MAPPIYTTRVTGLRELLTAADAASRDTKKLVRDELRKAAEPVRVRGTELLDRLNPGAVQRYGISIRRVGTVSVEGRQRKTTGNRPDWGRTQMRHALEPALEEKQGDVQALMEKSVDELADRFERRP